MLVDLVQTTTRDGLRLDGAVQTPAPDVPRPLAVDGFCLLHGTGGNFYSSTLLEGLAERLLAYREERLLRASERSEWRPPI